MRCLLAMALLLTPLSGCTALNHFGDFEAGDDTGPRMDGGQDAFAIPDGGVDAPEEDDAPTLDDAPLADDAPSDAPLGVDVLTIVDAATAVDASADAPIGNDANADAP